MSLNNSWYGLNLLPIYVDIIDERLESVCLQLKNLENVRTNPQQLNSETLTRIMKYCYAQKENNQAYFEQCSQWRNSTPNEEQLQLIARIEKSAAKLEFINQEILKLVESYQKKDQQWWKKTLKLTFDVFH
ncbi:hypothetical protein LEAN103870_15030 [Legionella anisa]|uniref:Uncharacterized protein n=1 Tax=Legionella anisa TaxID=28082 RepID=A0AAX0WYV2_9GAMM|nr:MULTISPECIES: hypothetical protein [Legionella]HAT9164517.1 hypothetical protein [Legionella pneumophila subsp. pneumophila]AOU90866.1 hypothetical protein A9E96_15060 [Legionella pneumophila]AWN76047.1 hypothetical protein DLD14_19405 [Legionella anisa]MCW8426864.1 hypothetical protein [Legionella anisa]MCW8449595.1 hypothetical protein [Legionella anisa]